MKYTENSKTNKLSGDIVGIRGDNMKKRVIIPIVILLFGCIVYFQQGENSNKQESIESVEEPVVTRMSGILRSYDVDSLMQNSNLVVYGEVTGKSEPFKVQPTFGGSPFIHTDYYFEPIDIISGDSDITDTTFRVEGGKIGNEELIVDDTPSFDIGSKYLLFLYKVDMGSGYNTDEDYYYVTGSNQGAFNQVDKTTFQSQNSSIGTVTTSTLITKSGEVTKEYSLREEATGYAKANLENGMITQEEYDETIQSFDTYATIVE